MRIVDRGRMNMKRTLHVRGKVGAAAVAVMLTVALSVTAAPSSASATSSTLEPNSTLWIGSIDFVYTGAGCSVDGVTLDCQDWVVFGGWIPAVDITADIDSFISGGHLQLSSLSIHTASGCVLTIGGPMSIDYIADNVYYNDDPAGAYWFDSCTAAEEAIFDSELGGSPSSEPLKAVFFVDPPPPDVEVTLAAGSSLELVGISLGFDLELDVDCSTWSESDDPAVVTPWSCSAWSGIEGTSSGVVVSADELVVDDGVVATLGSGSAAINVTIGQCVIGLDGDRDFYYESLTDSYVLAGEVVGAYALSGCTALEALLINSELGGSPSTQPLEGELLIEIN